MQETMQPILKRMGLGGLPSLLIPRTYCCESGLLYRELMRKTFPKRSKKSALRFCRARQPSVDPHRITHDCQVISSEKLLRLEPALCAAHQRACEAGLSDKRKPCELDTLPKSLIILGEGLMVSNMLRLWKIRRAPLLLKWRPAFYLWWTRVGASSSPPHAGGRRDTITHRAKAESLAEDQGGVVLTYQRADGQRGEVAGERVLVSIGRKADLEGLALEKAGVKAGPRVSLTAKSFRRQRRIYTPVETSLAPTSWLLRLSTRA